MTEPQPTLARIADKKKRGTSINIDTGDFDESAYPIPPKRVEPSAEVCNHTPHPTLYHAHYEWMERASKTHGQIRCPRCGNWSIWLPKAEAKIINARDRQEEREIARMVKKQFPSANQRYKQELREARKRGEIEQPKEPPIMDEETRQRLADKGEPLGDLTQVGKVG